MPTNTIWSVTGGGTLSPTNGSSSTFTASSSPGASVVTAQVAQTSGSITYTEVAPAAITASVSSNSGLPGLSAGPPNNQIGANTLFQCQLLPTNVSFLNAHIRENIAASDLRHWPDGETTRGGPQIKDLSAPGCGYTLDDQISHGPYPVARLFNGTNYVDFSFTRTWTNEYQNAASNWIGFATINNLTEFHGSNQTCRETYQGVQGSWQGPWQ
jgi:hypothetical protein